MKLTEKLLKEEIEKVMNEVIGRVNPPMGMSEPGGHRQFMRTKAQKEKDAAYRTQDDSRSMKRYQIPGTKEYATAQAVKRGETGATSSDTSSSGGGQYKELPAEMKKEYIDGAITYAKNKMEKELGELTDKMAMKYFNMSLKDLGDAVETAIKRAYDKEYAEKVDGANAVDEYIENNKMTFGDRAGRFFNKLNPFNESLTLSSNDIRRMIQEEIINVTKGK